MSTASGKKMILATIIHTGGQHRGAWRHPEAQADQGIDFNFYKRVAQVSEHGKFDFMFSADQLCVRNFPRNMMCRTPFTTFQVDPLTMLTALSAVTEHLGLIATMSSTYYAPYQIARHIAGLDLISGGRAGWNLVTSGLEDEARNLGLDAAPEHDERYLIGREVADIVQGYWATSEPGMFLGDKESGVLFDMNKIHRFKYEGKYRKAEGILSVPPSKQGRPVIVQAGASGPGRDLAASIADLVFSISPDPETAKEYIDDLRARATALGRDPSDIKQVCNFIPVIGNSHEEALAMLAELDELIDVEFAVANLEMSLGGIDLSPFPLDGPLPRDIPMTNASRTLFNQARKAAEKDGLTIRQLAIKMVRGLTSVIACGPPEHIADVLEDWFTSGAADGFLIAGNILPRDLEVFVDRVVPILQQRGLFRTEYEASTLRGNLGLPVPG